MQPSLRAVKLRGAAPKSSGTFVAPSATLIGKVQVGKFSSVWYGATLRADVSSITVGEHTTIGDRVMVHCSSQPKEFPTKIGNNVVVEAGCILHGCEIQDGSYIGEGTQVLDGARVEKNAAVAAGSLVSLGKVVPTGQLWGGVPATFQRNLTEDEIAAIRAASIENAELSVFHSVETSKNWEEIEHDEYEWDQTMYRPADAKVRPQSDADKRKYTGPGSILNTDRKLFSLFLSCFGCLISCYSGGEVLESSWQPL